MPKGLRSICKRSIIGGCPGSRDTCVLVEMLLVVEATVYQMGIGFLTVMWSNLLILGSDGAGDQYGSHSRRREQDRDF